MLASGTEISERAGDKEDEEVLDDMDRSRAAEGDGLQLRSRMAFAARMSSILKLL
jgi:hypothetical protein